MSGLSKILICISTIVSITSSAQSVFPDDSTTDFAQTIYDTCHVTYGGKVPREFWFKNDANYDLARSVDSVLYLKLVRFSNDIRNPKDVTNGPKLSAINQASYLGFLHVTSDIKALPDEFNFKNFKELRYIKLDVIPTEQQLEDLFHTATELRGIELDLKSKVPSCICELEHLRYLIIDNYLFKDSILPACLKNMENLKYLKIIRAGHFFDDVVWDLPYLESLTLSGGGTPVIRPTVKNMKRLRQMKISSMDSIFFPNEFLQLDSLEVFYLSHVEKRIQLPNDFSKFQHLRGLYLSNLEVFNYPYFSEQSGLFTIHFANLFSNQSTIDFDFEKLPYLKDISMVIPRQIEQKISLQTFQNMSDLRRIELLNNEFLDSKEYRDFEASLYKGYPYRYKNQYRFLYPYYENVYARGKPHPLYPKAYD
jgi:hypothetical protein